MQLNEFAGNARVKEQLYSLMRAGRMPHAFLLEGEKGSGRHTLAHIIARWAVCSSSHDRPCGHCPACKKAAEKNHPDIFIAEGTTPRSLHVDVIRQIRQDAYIIPNESERRVFLLFSAEAMTEQAQNALLKILEEPPAHVIFVLTCESRESLLLTVRSRKQALSLETLSPNEALPVLQKRCPKKSQEELLAAFEKSNGTIGSALSLLTSKKADKWDGLAERIALAVVDSKEYPLLALCGKFIKDKEPFLHCLEGLSAIFHEALRIAAGGKTQNETAKKLSMRLTGDRLIQLVSAVEETKAALLRNANMTLLTTCFCVKLRTAAFSQDAR